MDKARVIHDSVGQTLTLCPRAPGAECVHEQTSDEAVFMKDESGNAIGFESLHQHPRGESTGLTVDTLTTTPP